ncbi:MAG TPA: hypothetical protein VFB61_08550 [Gemmatimonadales bacterium]|nr:hypothetical protein [Gemmatimonadales bacterium]
MSRAFINEDAGAGDAPRYPLPSRSDPSFDLAAARALLHGADLGDTASAEVATGYYWGEPKLRPLVERIRDEALEDGDERLEQLAERFLRVADNKLLKHTEVMIVDRNDPESGNIDEILNPHRGEEQSRAREHTADILARRGILLSGEETDEELSDLWSAVERFESMVEARGGDTMTNAPTSAEPDNPAFVLPERKARESAREYTRRILEAAAALTRFERGSE